MKTFLSSRSVAAMLIALSSVEQSFAQVTYGDFTTYGTRYLQVSGAAEFGVPTLSEYIGSGLTFAPTNFWFQTDQNLPFDLQTNISTVRMTIKPAPGFKFNNNVLSISASGAYSIIAPLGGMHGAPLSQAFARATASYTLLVNEVDNSTFTYGAPLSANVAITPSDVHILGPGGLFYATWNGIATLDIDTIKTHFAIAPSSNITGMLLEFTSTLVGEGNYAQASISLENLVVRSSTTDALPQSTNVILTLQKATNVLGNWQIAPITTNMVTPSGELNMGALTNTNEFYRLKIRTVVE